MSKMSGAGDPAVKKTNVKVVKFHWVHLLGIGILGLYFFLSKLNLFHSLKDKTIVESFVQLYIFGAIFAVLFLYIFSHEKFFPFAKEIEKQEKSKEKKYLKKYIHHGKILGIFLIGAVGGPVFSALTARALLNDYWYKYLIVMSANIPSAILTLGLGHGLSQLMLK